LTALDKIDSHTSTGDELSEDIENIYSSISGVVDGIEELEELEKSIDGLSVTDNTKDVLRDVVDKTIDNVKALTYGGDDPLTDSDVNDIVELAKKKFEAAEIADGLKVNGDEERSDEAIEIVDKYVKAIAEVELNDGTDIEEAKENIDEIISELEGKIKEQDEKDAGKAALDKFCEDNDISLKDDERIAGILQEVKDEIQALDKGTDDDATFEKRVADVVAAGEDKLTAAEFRYDNPVTEKSNNAIDENDSEDLESALEKYNQLSDNVKEEVDKLYQPEYNSFEELIDMKKFAQEFNAEKDRIVKELEGEKKTHDGDLLSSTIDMQIKKIQDVQLEERQYTEAEQQEALANLKVEENKAVDEVDLGQNKQQKLNTLDEEMQELIDSGAYSEEAIEELKKIYAKAEEEINSTTTGDEIGDWKDKVEADKKNASDAFAKINVIAIATEGNKPSDLDSDELDYAERHNVDEDGYIGSVSNEKGMSSTIQLIIKKTDDKSNTEKTIKNASKNGNAIVATGSTLTEAQLNAALDDKELKVTLDAYLLQNGEKVENFDGSYTVKVLIPSSLRNVNNLQVVYIRDDGKVEVFETKVEGNYIIFTTTHFSDFQILGEKTVNLLWLALLLGGILVLEAVVIVFLIMKRREEKKGEEKAAAFGGFGIANLLTLYLPNGIIPTIIVLAVLVVIAAAAIVLLALRLKKQAATATESGSESENVNNNEVAATTFEEEKKPQRVAYAVVGETEPEKAKPEKAENKPTPKASKVSEPPAAPVVPAASVKKQEEKKQQSEVKEVKKHRSVSVEEAAASPDEIVAALVESEEYSTGKTKGIVNIDKISEAYSDGETVTVESLREKGLIEKEVDYVKVLARGTLDKALTIKVQEYSRDAIKMIVIAGGTAVRIKVKK